ncbi:MAG TPA: hypothetical protein VGN40_13110 [Lelliottia sp.]
MDDTICRCADCYSAHPKSEMRSVKTNIYPYKRMELICAACSAKRINRAALRATIAKARKSSTSRHGIPFKY